MVRQAPVICVMAPPIHLGEWSMALFINPRRACARVTVVQSSKFIVRAVRDTKIK